MLAAGYYINYLVGRPFHMVNIQLDLGAETNFTTWYASAKWLLVAAFFGVLAWRGFQKRAPSAYVMLLPVLLCTMLSADEVARVHEWIGRKADHALLPGGSRYTTPLLRSGIWMFVLVPPVAFAAWIGARTVVRFYAGAQASRVRAVVG